MSRTFPTRAPDPVPRDQARFRLDVAQALAVWRKQPALPLMSAMVGVLTAVSGSRWKGAGLAALVLIVFLGWVGAERLWYLRAFTGRTMAPVEALRWTLRYFGRFFRLGLLCSLVFVPPSIPVFTAMSGAARRAAESGQEFRVATGVVLYFAVLSLIIDFLLTFVTPALVYSTDSAVDAVKIGWELLRSTWPHAAAYVLLPPLAIVLLTRMASGPVGLVGGSVVTLTALLSLLARGTTCAFYLRLMPPAGPDGAESRSMPRAPAHSSHHAT